ncbi:BTB and MATH domain-containing protein 38 [Aphelenchoides avenae]|nr:BTB and MATH domain-containing protein 38 [Aphelenchus avenae]
MTTEFEKVKVVSDEGLLYDKGIRIGNYWLNFVYKCMKVEKATTIRWYTDVYEDREMTFGVRIRLMQESVHPTTNSGRMGGDVTLNVCGTAFGANKAYLSAVSPVLERMFNGDFREKNSDAVVVEDTTPADFGDFLACLYHTDLAIHEDNVVGLTLLADRYQVDYVLRRCLSYLRYSSKRYLVDSLTVEDAKKLLKDPKAADINGLAQKFIELFTLS